MCSTTNVTSVTAVLYFKPLEQVPHNKGSASSKGFRFYWGYLACLKQQFLLTAVFIEKGQNSYGESILHRNQLMR